VARHRAGRVRANADEKNAVQEEKNMNQASIADRSTNAFVAANPAIGRTPWLVRYLTWPTLFVANLTIINLALLEHWNLTATMAATTGTFIVVLVALEFAYPLDSRWRMTLRTFFGRDIKYFLAGGLTGAATNFGLAFVGISLSVGHVGPITHWPVWIAAPLLIVAFDFLQYWQHRWSHEADNAFKHYLWRTHAPHHLPEQVYVLMHPAGHPFNFFLIQGILRLPLFYVLGATPESIFVASSIIGLQGLVSHCNVDLRAGWANYVLTGTELHRYHHSGDPAEAKNFAVALSLLDVVFGTFVYRPGEVPARLGVARPNDYPQSHEFWKTMMIPLRTDGYM
jgi:sterol desaturase/sphingolipid hydroxylase (fatty acid hydroxylase superfamily)